MSARVLWLAKGLGLGGAERLLTLTAARIDPTRFQVEVAYVLPWKDAFVAELEEAGVRTHCLGDDGGVRARWVARLRRLLRERRYDVVHTHSPVPAAAARLLTRRPTPVIHTEHNVWDRYRRPTYVANALTYGRNDAVIAVSDGVAESIRKPWWAPRRYPPVETLLHGVEPDSAPRGPEARAAARRELGIAEDTPVIGNVANLTPKKDHAGLIEAFEQVRRVSTTRPWSSSAPDRWRRSCTRCARAEGWTGGAVPRLTGGRAGPVARVRRLRPGITLRGAPDLPVGGDGRRGGVRRHGSGRHPGSDHRRS
jgi:glycosyltransferase involved in cell wall biosynthesis